MNTIYDNVRSSRKANKKVIEQYHQTLRKQRLMQKMEKLKEEKEKWERAKEERQLWV